MGIIQKIRSLNSPCSPPHNKEDKDGYKKTKTWRELWYDFTQVTGLQAVRYVTEYRSLYLRRIIWLVILLFALGGFLYYFIDRVKYLHSYPRTVNLEVVYNVSVPFPAVTICNQNIFRQSLAQKYGLHDIISQQFGATGRDSRFKEYSGVKFLPKTMYNFGTYFREYRNVTLAVCKEICVQLESDCCSVEFNIFTHTCKVSSHSITGAMERQIWSRNVGAVNDPQTFTYQLLSCRAFSRDMCSFEQTLCDLALVTNGSFRWRLTTGENGQPRPLYDHTTATLR